MSASQVDRRTGIALLPEFKPESRAFGAADAVMAMVARWLRNRAAERRLSELSDMQLRDLGIARSEIGHAAWHGRD